MGWLLVEVELVENSIDAPHWDVRVLHLIACNEIALRPSLG